jgi:hypothetical protein
MKKTLNIIIFCFFLQGTAQTNLPILPDSLITPGDTFPGALENICRKGYTKEVRNVSKATKEKVFKLYKITQHKQGEFEIDHLIPLTIGGNNNIKNLWPQSYLTEPWNAHKKDRLENRLRRLICTGKITLQEAQYAIAHDWIAAYIKYIQEPVDKTKDIPTQE